MTNQIVYDHTGQNFEASGVPVDIEAVTFALANSGTEQRMAIDAALTALGSGDLANSNAPAADCSLMDARTRFELSTP